MAASYSIRDLYVNVDSRALTDSNGKTLLLPTMIELFKTQSLYRFHLKDAAGAVYPITTGSTFFFGVSNVAGDADADLVSSDNDQFVAADWSDYDLAQGKICARVNFNTTALDTALGTSAEITTPRGELWMVPPAGTATPLLQFNFTIRNIWTSFGDPPGASGLSYMTTAAYAAAIATLFQRSPSGDLFTISSAGEPRTNLDNPGVPWA